MHRVVLLRHGESTWNRENRFTGWTDVDLSERGREEAAEAGRLLQEGGYVFDIAYTSVLKRAIRTLHAALDALDLMWIPVTKSWRLNERHYGALQGLNKAETAARHGDAQTKIWRRSYDIPPPPLTVDDPRHPSRDPRYASLSASDLPLDRVAEGYSRTVPAVLARNHCADDCVGRTGVDRRARKLAARPREVSGRHLRSGHRRAQHSNRYSAGLRAGRRLEADSALLPGRCGGRRRSRRKSRQSGSARRMRRETGHLGQVAGGSR